jgi:hypothetical protein
VIKAYLKTLTQEELQLYLGPGKDQGALPCHNLYAAAPGPGRYEPSYVPMVPMDVQKDWFMDYVSPSTIKFYNKAIEKLPGEKFDGKMLQSWLQVVQDKAEIFAWNKILTINGKLLTQHYSEITLDQVREHAQIYQNEGRRQAQNAEMLKTCIKASISREVYNKMYLMKVHYTITREGRGDKVEDGVCYLKTLINAYMSNTRSSTAKIREQIAQLHIYMREKAKGNVQKLCHHARELLEKLNAAGETTHDLLTNLMTALKLAPDADFQRWLGNQIDLWSHKKIDYQPDGSDLMKEAEEYYIEINERGTWGMKKKSILYAYPAMGNSTDTEDEEEGEIVDKKPGAKKAKATTLSEEEIASLAARISQHKKGKKRPSNHDIEDKFKWKLRAPKDGDPTTKKVYMDGKKKVYHWCVFHSMWTLHSPAECKRIAKGRNKRKEFKQKKKEYLQAKAALQGITLSSESDSDDGTTGSNQSATSSSSESSFDSNIS